MSRRGGLHIFDEHVHIANDWLTDLSGRLLIDDPRTVLHVLRVCLHMLRDRVPVETAVHLGAQLPVLFRGFYYEGWKPSQVPSTTRHLDDFIRLVEAEVRNPSVDGERAMRVVLAFLDDHLAENATEKLRRSMPDELKALWSTAVP